MRKQDFTENNFTRFLDERNYDINEHIDIDKKCKLDINPDDFFEFMEKNWMDCFCLPYEPRPNLDATSNEQMELANRYGYHTGNTIKRDWGKNNPDHDEIFKEILGRENFEKLGMDPATAMVRLLCFLPGNMFPVHWDGFEGWEGKFNIKDKKPFRYLTFINPWSWGQYLQVHDNFITNWQPGDTYPIPPGVLHCSGNGGIVPKITMTITGLV